MRGYLTDWLNKKCDNVLLRITQAEGEPTLYGPKAKDSQQHAIALNIFSTRLIIFPSEGESTVSPSELVIVAYTKSFVNTKSSILFVYDII